LKEHFTIKELAGKIRDGDQEAFKELVNEFQEPVLRTCMGFLHNHDDAEDITQEVFIEVFESIEKFRGDAKLSTWIYRIAVNKSLNFIRSTKKRQFFGSIESLFKDGRNSENEIADVRNEPHQKMEETERASILKEAIGSLAKNQKIAFTLHKYDELSYKQIADVMELSLSSVESLIFRAKSNLQKKLISYYKK
jgi:RNA polymerase sigma-70 factor (ECF subfamily)